jgi:ketosteroid isomerase-like protein
MLVVGLVPAAAACGGARAGRIESETALAVEREVGSWHHAWHQAFARGDIAAYASAFLPSALLVTAGPDDARVGGAAIAAELKHDFGPLFEKGLTLAIAEGPQVAGVAELGQSAWIGDVLDYRVELEGAPAAYPLRHTVLVDRAGDAWRVQVAHYSRAVPGDEARRREEDATWPPLADMGEGVAEDAQPLAQLVSQALGDVEIFTSLVSKRPGVLAFGPGPGDHFNGTHEVSEFLRALFAREGARLRRAGGMRGGLTASGDAGWIATNVDLLVARGERDYTRPCRMTAVFAREGDTWAVVQLHLSHGVRDAAE